jgi:hypothetical protein
VVSKAPVSGTTHSTLSFGVRVYFKVPNASRSTNYELNTPDDKRIDPKKSKHEIDKNASCLSAPVNVCYEGII